MMARLQLSSGVSRTMSFLRVRIAALVALMCLAACASGDKSDEEWTAQRTLRDAALGCYRLELTDSVQQSVRDTILGNASVFRLHAASVSAKHPEIRKVTAAGAGPVPQTDYHHRVWTADSRSDSIAVSIGNGFTGISLVLAPNGGVWTGYAATFSDDRPPLFSRREASARAERVSCSDVPSLGAGAG